MAPTRDNASPSSEQSLQILFIVLRKKRTWSLNEFQRFSTWSSLWWKGLCLASSNRPQLFEGGFSFFALVKQLFNERQHTRQLSILWLGGLIQVYPHEMTWNVTSFTLLCCVGKISHFKIETILTSCLLFLTFAGNLHDFFCADFVWNNSVDLPGYQPNLRGVNVDGWGQIKGRKYSVSQRGRPPSPPMNVSQNCSVINVFITKSSPCDSCVWYEHYAGHHPIHLISSVS